MQTDSIKLFLCGDVMTGRGIDQILPYPVDPGIYESYVKDARVYVNLAEQESGKIKQPVPYSYIWGDALEVWKKNDPFLKIINLETSITTHDIPWPGKGINYRMHPKNTDILVLAGIDCSILANNHTLDWGKKGLEETLLSLKKAGITVAGAGMNEKQAREPAVFDKGFTRILVFAYGSITSGIPLSWEADYADSGINLLKQYDKKNLTEIADHIESFRKPGDIIVFSVHWGGNWGYDISENQRVFAHELIDKAHVDIIHGHSSHHPLGIEVYKEKLIIYGAGDFINDYEGISGYEKYRDDLTLMYFPEVNPKNGQLKAMKLVPMQIKKMRLNYPGIDDVKWLLEMLNREGKTLNSWVHLNQDHSFSLHW